MIQNVLQSIPLYLLSAINPPKKVIERLHQMFARFFWRRASEEKEKHWVTWEEMCYLQLEEEIGYRFLFDVSKTLYVKL